MKDEMGMTCKTNGEEKNAYGILMEKPKEGDRYEDQGVGGRIILKWVL
jgi:hypothetical protein